MVQPSRRAVIGSLGGLLTGRVAGNAVGSDGQASEFWYRTFDDEYQCMDLVSTDTGVLVLGRTGRDQEDDVWVASLDTGGEVRWTTNIEVSGRSDVISAVPAADGYVIAGETGQSPGRWLVRLDTTGAEQWRKRPTRAGSLTDLTPHEGGYLAVGESGIDHDDSLSKIWVRAVDSSGTSRWERSYKCDHATSITPWDDGYLIAGAKRGDAWVQAIEDDGTPRSEHTYGGVGSENAHTAVGTDDGIVYLGLTESIPRVDSRGMIVKTTRDGDFVWRRTYDMEAVSGLVRTGDGFVAVGEPPFGSTDLDVETLVYTLDSRGRLRETVGLTSSVGDLTGVVRLNQNSVAVAGTEFSDGPWVRAVVLA
ncbi:hypothetical protein IL252_02680 [Halomicrobium sp. IBSBa]|uniref:hypothetical protein n=1 Tax=Halomicrobium sp. IBSBa TaxID=2778916 RepID=UPI001ABF751B|nr:hypothetical protein [Halomicrobium sp. IBSBa]MBO4246721.1 hypothetical protein [Halomicrobium sp. IBSBa]